MEQALDLKPQSLAVPPQPPGKKAAPSATPSVPATASFDDDPHAALRAPAGPVLAGTSQAAVRLMLQLHCLEPGTLEP